MLKDMIRKLMGDPPEQPDDHPSRFEIPLKAKEKLFKILVSQGAANEERFTADDVMGYRIPKHKVEQYRSDGWSIVDDLGDGESYTGEI